MVEAQHGVAARIRGKLTEALTPSRLEIVDDSRRHAHHAHGPKGGESHFNVEIVSSAFAGENRVARQRRVYAILAEELAGPVHALAITALTPEEDRQN